MSFRLAYPTGVHVPYCKTRAIANASAWNLGALTVVDGNGNWAECGANPVSVAAVQLGAVGTDSSGFNITAKYDVPPGFSIGMGLLGIVFEVQYPAAQAGSIPAVDEGFYGVIRDTDSSWKIDFTNITNTVVQLVDRSPTLAPESRNIVLVKFMPDVIQQF